MCGSLLGRRGMLQHNSVGEKCVCCKIGMKKKIKSINDLTKMCKETHVCLSLPFVFLQYKAVGQVWSADPYKLHCSRHR